MDFDGIIEVTEANHQQRATKYLEAGYRLLSIQATARADNYPNNGSSYVRRRIVYVLGRTADVAHIEPEPYRAPTEVAT